MNNQRPLPIVHNNDDIFSITEIFESFQGEGEFAGKPALFIRFAGCNLQCPHCDTLYPENARMVKSEIVQRIIKYGVDSRRQHYQDWMAFPLIVLAGGEPTRQPIENILDALMEESDLLEETDLLIQLETNGMRRLPLKYYKDLVSEILSPKSPVYPMEYTGAVKLVVGYVPESKRDLETGLPLQGSLGYKFVLDPKKLLKECKEHGTPFWIQPECGQGEIISEETKAYILWLNQKFGYRISCQTHKLLGAK